MSRPPQARRTPPLLALVCWALLLSAGSGSAAGFLAMGLEARLLAANDILLGRVVSVEVEQRQGEPWTVVGLLVERAWLRDGAPSSEEDGGGNLGDGDLVRAWFWGGRAPGLPDLLVAGMPEFQVDERVILLLRSPEAASAAATVGVGQGVWRERDGLWLGDDGSRLGLDADGRLALDGVETDEAGVFAAIEAAVQRLRGQP